MNIIKRFIKKFFNVFLVLLLFLTLNVTTIKAETEYTEDNIFYSIGAFINATIDGIATRINEIDIINLGKNYARNLIDNGARMSDIVKVRGNEIAFNPHGKINLVNFIDGAYGAYNDFANYAVSKVEDDRYIIDLNYSGIYSLGTVVDGSALRHNTAVYLNFGGIVPSGFHHAGNLINVPIDYNIFSQFHSVRLSYSITEGNPDADRYILGRNVSKSGTDLATSSVFYNNESMLYTPDLTKIGGVVLLPNSSLYNRDFRSVSYELGTLVFFNDNYEIEKDIVPYNMDDIPTKEEFTAKLERTYEPGKAYTYNIDEILNDNTVINNEYITNNYTTIEEVVEDDDIPVGDSKDYTSVLDKILSAIKDLPKNIADKLDFPEGSGEEGGGFWSGLFGVVGDLATSLTDLVTSLPELVIALLDGILGLVEKVVELFVPTAEQVEELKGSLDLLVDDLTGKFDFVLEPVDQIKSVYSKPQSIYSITFEYDDEVIYLFPHFLKSSIDKLKVLLNGAVVLTTFITIYKRFVGREDLIK